MIKENKILKVKEWLKNKKKSLKVNEFSNEYSWFSMFGIKNALNKDPDDTKS